MTHGNDDATNQSSQSGGPEGASDGEAVRTMSESTVAGETLARALDVLVPNVADYAFLHMEVSGGALHEVALRHRDPALEGSLARMLSDAREKMTAPGSVIDRAFRDGTALLSPIGSGPASGRLDRPISAALGPRSYMVVPVWEGDVRYGVLTLARFEDPRAYGSSDLPVAEALACQLALLLTAAHREEETAAGIREARENAAAERTRLEAERKERVATEEVQSRALKAVEEAEHARQAAEGELREAHERARTTGRQGFEARLLDAVGEAVIATDLDGRIVYWNRAAERLYGWSRGEAVGRDLGDTAPAVTSKEQASKAMARMMAGESWSGELRVRRKDGSTFPASLTGTPIFGDSGEPIGLISISSDLTAQKKLEERLMQAQRAQAVGRVAGGVAHEFNNCLTSISGYTKLIRREFEEDDPLVEDLDAIEQSAKRAAQLTQQLLAYTRRQVLRPRVASLNEILEGIEPVLRSLVGDDITFTVDRGAESDNVRVDRGQIEQVITNLVLNAEEAVEGPGEITIRTETLELTDADVRKYTYQVNTGSYVSLVVGDDGAGMDAETQQHAFEPFFTTKEDGLGVGLGLSTAYGVVKQSGGYVWVHSELTKGTTVRLVLPLAQAVEEEEGEGEPRASAPERRDSVVLLVEDDASVRDLARRVLVQDRYEVLEAEDGIAALKLWDVHHDRIDLVVTDVVMPRMSGRALVDRLRTLRPGLPALFMSGYTGDAVALHGITEGRDPFLGKPFSTESFSAKVRDLLGALATSQA